LPNRITYYAIVGGRNAIDNPRGLVRRLDHDDGPSDEALRADFSWKATPVLAEWESGNFDDELVEVSHEQAERIIQYFRKRWGPYGQVLDSSDG
jgi:hypothetical protein